MAKPNLSEFENYAEKIEKKFGDNGSEVPSTWWIDMLSKTRTPIENVQYLSHGGESWTLLGIEKELNRKIVIKVYRPKFYNNDPAADERIRRCCRIQDRLSRELRNCTVPSILSHSLTWDRHIVVNYIEGKDIFSATSGWNQKDVLKLFIKLCEAVAEYHLLYVVNRDLKPDNIFVKPDGGIAIIDWGSSFNQKDDHRFTEQGVMIGSPLFASVEQMSGDSVLCDHRSDISSLGDIMCYLLVRKRVEAFKSKLHKKWMPVSKHDEYLPDNLRTVFKKATSEKSERYRSTEKFLEAVIEAGIKDGLIEDEDLKKKTMRIQQIREEEEILPLPARVDYQKVQLDFVDFFTSALKKENERLRNEKNNDDDDGSNLTQFIGLPD